MGVEMPDIIVALEALAIIFGVALFAIVFVRLGMGIQYDLDHRDKETK